MNNQYNVELFKRNQYEFNCTDKQLSCLATRNVRKSKSSIDVAVIGLSLTKISSTLNNVKIVVGEGYPTDSPITRREERQFEKNMEKLKINYKKKKVLQVVHPYTIGTPGIWRLDVSALICKNISFINNYIGESIYNNGEYFISIIYDIDDGKLDEAIEILSDLIIDKCEKKLCINRFNVDKKCIKNNCNC